MLPLGSQTRLISDGDLLASQEYLWSKDTIYFLDGLVVLEEGSSLTIEAGTLVKGLKEPTNGEYASALIIARGAQIIANGTVDNPIIFTSELDDTNDPADLHGEDSGLWGGLIILGAASIGDQQLLETSIDGIAPPDERYFFGGTDDEDDSGILRFVSIRHGGIALHENEGDYLEGLTLAGVGRRTTIEHVETFACAHDGFKLLGGTAQAKYLVAAFNGEDAFEFDLGWKGKGQFWFGLNSENAGDKGGEFDGQIPQNIEELAKPILSNLTLIGASCADQINAANSTGVSFTHSAGGIFVNNIIQSFDYALAIEDLPEGLDSKQLLENGNLVIKNNIWFNFCQGEEWSADENSIIDIDELAEDTTAASIVAFLPSNSNGLFDPAINCICRTPDQCLNPLLSPGSLALGNAIEINDPFFDAVTYVGAFDAANNWLLSWTALASNNYLSSCLSLEGRIIVDENLNCGQDESENNGFGGWIISFISNTNTYFATTDANGHFIGKLEPGPYIIRVNAPNELWLPCENDLPITIPEVGNVVEDISFLVQAVSSCPSLNIDVGTPFLRRCFENTYSLNYCNWGTADASDIRIEMELDTFFHFLQSSIPPTLHNGQLLVFDVDQLAIGECGEIKIDVELSCDAPLGLTHCVEAHIYPDTICSTSTPTPRIEVDGICLGDSLIFELNNIGTQDMQVPEEFVVIEDDVIFIKDNFQLPVAQSRLIPILANGKTYRVQAPEFPGNPQTKFVSKTIEGCGAETVNEISTGYVNQFPEPDHAVALSIDCQQNIGSFDPNDKQGFPSGVSPQNFIDRKTSLEYLLRFQNTGSDTAFNVTLVDTIATEFIPSSLLIGASSHPFQWRLQGQVLTFNFNTIMLPDSASNEPASHGFVKFRIDVNEEVPNETQLFNAADIYFDFNAPVKTNRTLHTVKDAFLDILQYIDPVEGEIIDLQVYPNPAANTATFKLKGYPFNGRSRIQFYDVIGRPIRTAFFTGQTFIFEKNNLPAGLYFFSIQSLGKPLVEGRLILH